MTSFIHIRRLGFSMQKSLFVRIVIFIENLNLSCSSRYNQAANFPKRRLSCFWQNAQFSLSQCTAVRRFLRVYDERPRQLQSFLGVSDCHTAVVKLGLRRRDVPNERAPDFPCPARGGRHTYLRDRSSGGCAPAGLQFTPAADVWWEGNFWQRWCPVRRLSARTTRAQLLGWRLTAVMDC